MKLKINSLAATFLMGVIPAVCHAQEFSADVVYLRTARPNTPSTGAETSSHPSSKIYASKDRMRLETRGLTGTVLLVNGGEHTVIALYPEHQAYQPLPNGPSEYFRVENAEDACSDWQKAANQKIVCEPVGREVVDGRPAVKYQNKGASEAASAIWMDLALKFVVKWERASGGAELRNIQEAPQAADLFAVPPGYELLKPQRAPKGFPRPKPR